MIYHKITLLIWWDTFRMHLIPFFDVFNNKTIRHCKHFDLSLKLLHDTGARSLNLNLSSNGPSHHSGGAEPKKI